MPDYDNSFSESHSLGYWAGRAALYGTVLGAGVGVYRDIAANKILNPFRANKIGQTYKEIYSPEVRAARLAERFETGAEDVLSKIRKLSIADRDILAESMAQRFNSPAITTEWAKYRGAGENADIEAFWSRYAKNTEVMGSLRKNATALLESNGSLVELPNIPARIRPPNEIRLPLTDTSKMIEILNQNFGLDKYTSSMTRTTTADTVDMLQQLSHTLGTGNAYMKFSALPSGAGTMSNVAHGVTYRFGQGVHAREVTLPIVHGPTGLVFNRGNISIAGMGIDVKALKGATPDFAAAKPAHMFIHEAVQERITAGENPFTAMKNAVQDFGNLYIHQMPEYHSLPAELSEGGALALKNRTRLVLMGTEGMTKEELVKLESNMAMNPIAGLQGDWITAPAQMNKRVIRHPGMMDTGMLSPMGYMSNAIDPMLKPFSAIVDPFARYRGVPGRVWPIGEKKRAAMEKFMKEEARGKSRKGYYAGRRGVREKLFNDNSFRVIGGGTTFAAEELALTGGQQIHSYRMSTLSQEAADWITSRNSRILPLGLGEEEYVASKSLSMLQFTTTKKHTLAGRKTASRLKTIMEYPHKSAVGTLYEALQQNRLEDYLTTVAPVGGRLKHSPERVQKEVREMLSFKKGEQIGLDEMGNIVLAGKYGTKERITALVPEANSMSLYTERASQFRPGWKLFGPFKGTLKQNLTGDELKTLTEQAEYASSILKEMRLTPDAAGAHGSRYQRFVGLNKEAKNTVFEILSGEYFYKGLSNQERAEFSNQGFAPTLSSREGRWYGKLGAKEYDLTKDLERVMPNSGWNFSGLHVLSHSERTMLDRRASYTQMIGGKVLDPIFGKQSTWFGEAVLSEIGRSLYHPSYAKQIKKREADAILSKLSEGGIRRFNLSDFTKIHKRGPVEGEQLPFFITEFKTGLKSNPETATFEAAYMAGIFDDREMRAIRAIRSSKHPEWLVRSAQEWNLGYAPEALKEMVGSSTGVDRLRTELGEVMNQVLGSRPWHVAATPGGSPEMLGGGQRGTFSQRSLRGIDYLNPEFGKMMRTQSLNQTEVLGSLAEMIEPLHPEIGLKPQGTHVSAEVLDKMDFFNVSDPMRRAEMLSDLGVAPGKNMIIDLPNAIEWGEGKTLKHLNMPTNRPEYFGLQPILDEEIGTVKRPIQRLYNDIVKASIMTGADKTLGAAHVQDLEEYIVQQGVKSAGKMETGQVFGSLQLQAGGLKGTQIHGQDIPEFTVAVRESTLRRAMRDIHPNAGNLLPKNVVAGVLREPAIFAGRFQMAQVKTIEDIISHQKFGRDFSELSARRAEAVKEAANKFGSKMVYVTAGFGQAAMQVDLDADQLMIKFLFRQGSVEEQSAFRTVQELKTMHGLIGNKFKGIQSSKILTEAEKMTQFEALWTEGVQGMGKDGISTWAKRQYRLSAIAEIYKPYLKGTKPAYSMAAFRRGTDEYGKRITSNVVAAVLEKGEIGALSNALSLFHEAAAIMPEYPEDKMEKLYSLAHLIEESPIKSKTKNIGLQNLLDVEELMKVIQDNPANEKVLDRNKGKFEELLRSTIFKGKTNAEIGPLMDVAPDMLDILRRARQSAMGKAQSKIRSGRKDLVGYLTSLFSPEAVGGEQNIFHAMYGLQDDPKYRAAKYASEGVEVLKDIGRSLGRRKGLLLAGVGAAVGMGLLFGKTGEIEANDGIQNAKALNDSELAPSTRFPGTARVTPGALPTVAARVPSDRGMDWESIAASTGTSLPPTRNPAIITNVSDYRQRLNPDYIVDQMTNG